MKIKIFQLILMLIVFNLNFFSSAFSSEPNDINATNPATGRFWQDLKSLPKVSLDDAKKTYFNSDNLLLLLMAGGGSIALQDRADEKIAEHFEGKRSISTLIWINFSTGLAHPQHTLPLLAYGI